MPKVESRLQQNRFLIPIYIQKVKITNNQKIEPEKDKGEEIIALIDTGATSSAICNNIVNKLNLEPIGKTIVQTASDDVTVSLYNVLITIPADLMPTLQPIDPNNLAKGPKLALVPKAFINTLARVSDSNNLSKQNIGAIIGMDILRQFHITILNEILIMSY